jgi:ABC-type lipoprotein export system ATPase subunit
VIVEIEELCFKRGALPIIDIPSWQLACGEQAVIHGPSGSGKSTLLHLIAGLLTPSAGSLRVCGRILTELSEAKRDRFRARHLSYIFQSFNLVQGYSALENVCLGMYLSGRSVSRSGARAVLAEMGLEHRFHHRPHQLSIGEQQRVAVARALAMQPQLILADEPTGSIDPRQTDIVISTLRSACQDRNCSLILVSHDHRVVQQFDHQISFMHLNAGISSEAEVAP